MYQEYNPLCDEIRNIRAPNLQIKPTFEIYSGERDPMAHIKAFKMKFKLKFGINENLMDKYIPTMFHGDALSWYFSLPT